MSSDGSSRREGDTVVGTVAALWRFPVKSTAGEALMSAVVEERGLAHDRRWAVYTADGGIASGKTTRRFRKVHGLLHWRSTMEPKDTTEWPLPILHNPEGADFRVDTRTAEDALSRAFGQPLTLRPETSVRHHDESGVHLVTTAAIRAVQQLVGDEVDVRRLRANVVLDATGVRYVEDNWTGYDLALGPEVVLRIGAGMPRCVMVDQPQAGVPAGRGVLKKLGAVRDTLLGVQASVIRTGTVEVGDTARLLPR